MKVGIDIDDVICEHFGPLLEYINEVRGTKFEYDKLTSSIIPDVFDITFDEIMPLIESFGQSGKANVVNLISGAKESITCMSEKHDAIFITSRPASFENMTKEFLKMHGFNLPLFFSKHIVFGGNKTKAEICIENNVDIMIEDSIGHAKDCAKNGIKVILINRPWNQNFEHKDIIRVNTWKEILEFID